MCGLRGHGWGDQGLALSCNPGAEDRSRGRTHKCKGAQMRLLGAWKRRGSGRMDFYLRTMPPYGPRSECTCWML